MAASPGGVVHIIDDDAHVLDSTRALLNAVGIGTRCHASGEAFLADFDLSSNGCILLDLHMPGLSGFQVLDNLQGRGNALPVILFSGHADLMTERLGKESGAAALLTKPVDPAQLVALVRRMLAGNHPSL